MSDSLASTSTSSFASFAGFDWAKDEHDIVIVAPDGRILEQFQFEDTAEGWATCQKRFARHLPMAVAIETSCGAAVDRLLQLGVTVYPIQPMAAKRYRERKAPTGVKDNALDAWSLADALRLDGHTWRALQPEDPLTQELRILSRDEVALIEQRTALINQLQQAIYEYYPAARRAFKDWTLPCSWQFILQFSTPEILARAGKRKWEKFLRSNGLYNDENNAERLEIFANAKEFQGIPPVTAAKSVLAVAIAKQLFTLEEQLTTYRRRIRELFAQHPDHEIYDSLPGLGEKLAPRLLSRCAGDRFGSTQEMQCVAGTAPVSKVSGKSRIVSFRYACDKLLRATVHHWANLSRDKCAWAQAYYQSKREEDKMSHAAALRCLGQRWLKILNRMLETRTLYDEALHLRNQVAHGSWVIKLLPTATPA